MIPKTLTIRCPRLGGPVPFDYCEAVDGAPCAHILDCWWQRFDVEAYLRQGLGTEELEALRSRSPQTRMAAILGAVRKAVPTPDPDQG